MKSFSTLIKRVAAKPLNTDMFIIVLMLSLGLGTAQAKDRINYFHSDISGSPIAATNDSGEVLWEETYKPYGERLNTDNTNKTNNSQWFTGKQEEADLGLQYFGARWYHQASGRFISRDPAAVMDHVESNPMMFNRYAYANNNPYRYIDPDGYSPISVIAKQIAKQGVKGGINKFAKGQMRRLGRYMNKSQKKEFLSDVDNIVSTLDSSPMEIAIELIPVAGDLYGAGKFGNQVAGAYDKMQNLENKWVGKIYNGLPAKMQKKFKISMRNAGVRDAKQDQGIANSGSGLEGHHKTWVSRDVSQASDPRNIEFLTRKAHQQKHR